MPLFQEEHNIRSALFTCTASLGYVCMHVCGSHGQLLVVRDATYGLRSYPPSYRGRVQHVRDVNDRPRSPRHHGGEKPTQDVAHPLDVVRVAGAAPVSTQSSRVFFSTNYFQIFHSFWAFIRGTRVKLHCFTYILTCGCKRHVATR